MSRTSSRQARAAETTRARAAANVRERAVPRPVNECVLYARVSSKDQEKEGFSIPSQLRLLRDYAETAGMTVVQEFVDVETAKRAGRTHFTEMLEVLRDRPSCKTVLVEKTDRLYRNITDWVTLDELHLDIHLVKEGTVLSEGSRSSEKFIHGIKVLMAKNYIDNLSEETRKGMFEKVQQGIWPGPAPLGYQNVRRDDGKNVIAVDVECAPFVVQLFQNYASGDYSLADLAKWADQVGLRSKKGNKLQKASIHVLLKNPLYIGEFDWHGTTYTANHQPLVSRELFEKVLDLLGERALVSRQTQFREFAFSGLLECAWCASEGKSFLLVGEIHKEKYTYYTCQECKRLGRVVYHRERVIEAAFLARLQRLWIDPVVLDQLRTALRASHAEIVGARNREVGRIQAQIQAVQTRLDRAYDDRLDGRLSIDEYERRANGWRDEQARLRRELDAHAGADQATMEQGIALLELATTAVRLWERQDPTAKRKILGYLTLNSVFGEEGLTVRWREPFDQLAEFGAEPEDENGRELTSSAERPKWLPVGVRAEGASAEALYTWQVSIELPPHPGFALRRHRPAGHAKGKAKGLKAASGPTEDRGGQGCGPGVETVEPDLWAGALARARAHLERARRYRAWLEGGAERTLKELGELEGVSKARVSQLVSLLDLAPEIIADLERPGRVGPVPSELALRHIAALPDAERQVAQYRAVCAPAEAGLPRREGFQHEFARARRYQELLESGEHESLSSLGRAEGITGARVGQVLLMLHLAPEIIAALDVPLEQTPEGVTMKLVREIARKRSQATQRRMFEARWPGVLSQAAAAK